MSETQEEQRVEQLLAPLRRLEPAGLPRPRPPRPRRWRGVVAVALPLALVAVFVALRPGGGRSTITAVAQPGQTVACGPTSLSVRLSDGGVAGGSTYYRIVLRNVGRATCLISRYPGVVALGVDGRQVGAAAVRAVPRAPRRIAVPAGGAANALLAMANWRNFEQSRCRPVRVVRLRIDLPGLAAPVVVPYPGAGAQLLCSAIDLRAGNQMIVLTVASGSG
jgi:hypothetical protein